MVKNVKEKRKNILKWIIILIIGIVILAIIINLFNSKKINLDSNKIVCSEKLRSMNVCAEIYMPVCGYPQKIVYSNSCSACIDKNVEYSIEGEC